MVDSDNRDVIDFMAVLFISSSGTALLERIRSNLYLFDQVDLKPFNAYSLAQVRL
ncbi:hypothetical protein GCM10009425_44860 [Pseudomonas asuensis]|uniref:Uncharacterized protein n=1 Tax=Pseudomonas asuensis TaxID=1825787 RepID=A0ABQ2H449_9PSED|nr:hypothetical protein GCM10009425_44860 [Pseudomonas asuensis]